ncbi:fumarate hydratase [Hippea maritima]|uniref:Hydro-lyase, Fe-S type, tartrate/fumarate subfamily, alpha subunit n=1 Tax=Hippea maritima (strain ATCC 700847 / DSM 10411 / MH2) TaxID=760142 RepID=F2LX57_HIPMA|nr:fumarate hydratase [Hippea maritima]AEA33115.1 hydro-lyase, Fe-S type, tartrate/fumarate subfamily, alpha subunit [Hippea maritima DSM 10411]
MAEVRSVSVKDIEEAVYKLALEAAYHIPEDVLEAEKKAYEKEKSPVAKQVLETIFQNIEVSSKEEFPLCQDTGLAVIFLEVGQDVHFTDGYVVDAINKGVERAYKDGYLRKSTCHPLTRENYGNNLPTVVHTFVVPGNKVKIIFDAKGGGSESMSKVQMLKPADGRDGIIQTVVDWVIQAGPNPCPPVIVGVGIGGDFERAAVMAKHATLRHVGKPSDDPVLAEMEQEILEKVNNSGIGPAGLGGLTTCLGVHIEMEPCHIATLPLGINIACHVNRHKEIEL